MEVFGPGTEDGIFQTQTFGMVLGEALGQLLQFILIQSLKNLFGSLGVGQAGLRVHDSSRGRAHPIPLTKSL